MALILFDLKFKVPGIAYGALAVFVGLVGHKTNWLLILPLSRKKLFFWHLVEMLAAIVVATLISAIPFLIRKDTSGYAEYFLFAPFIVGFTKYSVVFRQAVGARQDFDTKLGFNKRALIALTFGGIFFLVMEYKILSLVAFFLIVVCVVMILVPAIILQPPLALARRLKVAGFTLAIGLSLLTVVGSLYGLFYAKPSGLTGLASAFWEGLPVKVGEARGLELLKSEKVDGDLADELVERAKHCQSHSCVKVTTALAANRADEAKFDVLKALLLEGSHGKSKAKNPKYDYCDYLTGWEKPFAASQASLLWLKESDPIQQTFAIKILSGVGANADQLKAIEKLAESNVIEVSSAAKAHVAVFQNLALANKVECDKDPKGKSCKHYKVAPAFETFN
jgi:hypothetical protein